MTHVADKEPVHTYLDDIKFQTVKENRRTSFVSIDHQIVAKNAQAIRDIEKHQRLKTADYKRQENAYLQKLEKLRRMKVEKCTPETQSTSKDLGGRRHSAPTVFWAQLSQSQQTGSTPLSRTNTNVYQAMERAKTFSTNLTSASPCRTEKSKDDSQNTFVRMSSKPSPEARRMSFDIQQETSKSALKKLDLIVRNQKRRATIAEGVQSNFVSLVKIKSAAVNRSPSIEEDECFD